MPKRGKKLPALGFHFSPSEDRVVHGWDWRGYVNERFSQEEDFRKRTELAGRA